MLIEALMQDTNFNLTIDDFLEDIRRIYIRDNGDNKWLQKKMKNSIYKIW